MTTDSSSFSTTDDALVYKAAGRYYFDTARSMWEWERERDEATFVRHGYWCEIKRNPELKTLCGYVLIGRTHPYWTLNVDLDVHGGVTFDDSTKVGFDCAHAGDLIPRGVVQMGWTDPRIAMGNRIPETYRNWAFVEREVDKLAKQLRALDTRETTMTQPDPD